VEREAGSAEQRGSSIAYRVTHIAFKMQDTMTKIQLPNKFQRTTKTGKKNYIRHRRTRYRGYFGFGESEFLKNDDFLRNFGGVLKVNPCF